MRLGQFHYLPLTPGFFSISIALFVGLLVIMIVIGALRHAYAAAADFTDRQLIQRTDRGVLRWKRAMTVPGRFCTIGTAYCMPKNSITLSDSDQCWRAVIPTISP
jgi:hypothetical protein